MKNALRALAFALAAVLGMAGAADAQDTVKIGLLSDIGGPYADVGGKGSFIAAQMAVADFGPTVLGKKIELISADHQGKPDVGAAIARQWLDHDGVSMITDISGSPIALAVQALAAQRKRITMVTSGSTDALTNAQCSPYGVHWVYDSYSIGKTVSSSLATPASKWFFITVDNAGGAGLQKALTGFLDQAGAVVVGTARHPLGTADFASYLLQAQASGAQYVVLANSGSDVTNAIKQAKEFGLRKNGQTLVALALFLSDIRALGLNDADGIQVASGFYSERNQAASAWARRFLALHHAMPNDVQVGTYSAVLQYLKAVKAADTLDADAVMARLRQMPVDDAFATGGYVRMDGRMVHEMYLLRAKLPTESRGPDDLVAMVTAIPGEQAFRPLSESACPLVKQ